MSKQFDNTNRGALFVNDRKEGERDADYSGSLNVDGNEYWVSGWKKTSKAGKPFLSLSVKPKQARRTVPDPEYNTPPQGSPESEIPF